MANKEYYVDLNCDVYDGEYICEIGEEEFGIENDGVSHLWNVVPEDINEALLESDGLIFSLEESKKLSDEASVQITNAKITEERIDNNRMLYLPMAKLATLVFFAISELSNLENIYQFSISWYIKDILISRAS